MSAVVDVRERSAAYRASLQPTPVRHFDLLAAAPGGVVRLREMILSLAIQGKLVPQSPDDEPTSSLIARIAQVTARLVAERKIRRERPVAAIADENLPFDIPNNWAWIRLGDLGTVGSSSRVHQKDWRSSGVPFYRAREIVKLSKHGEVDNELFISEDLFQELAAGGLVPERWDIMITGVGTIGVPYVVQGTDRFYFKDASVLIFKNQHNLVAGFLSLFMQSPYWVQKIHADSMGTTVNTLTISRASEVPVPLPPLAEQARIVARVDELMRLCDALEAKGRLEAEQHARLLGTLLGTLTDSSTPEELTANWQRVADHFDLLLDRPEAVDALEQTILQLAVRGLLVPQDPSEEPATVLIEQIRAARAGRLADTLRRKPSAELPKVEQDEWPFEPPPGWVWTRFGEVTQVSGGVTLGRKGAIASPVSRPYLRVANVQRWKLALDSMKDIVIDETELPRYQLAEGDLLITEGGDWDKVGRTAIWRSELPGCLHQNHVFKARGYTTTWNPGWAELYLNLDVARAYFAASAKQTTNLASINMTELRHCVFPLPPLNEQARIIARVTELRRVCAELRQCFAARQTTQSHLAEAMIDEVA